MDANPVNPESSLPRYVYEVSRDTGSNFYTFFFLSKEEAKKCMLFFLERDREYWKDIDDFGNHFIFDGEFYDEDGEYNNDWAYTYDMIESFEDVDDILDREEHIKGYPCIGYGETDLRRCLITYSSDSDMNVKNQYLYYIYYDLIDDGQYFTIKEDAKKRMLSLLEKDRKFCCEEDPEWREDWEAVYNLVKNKDLDVVYDEIETAGIGDDKYIGHDWLWMYRAPIIHSFDENCLQ